MTIPTEDSTPGQAQASIHREPSQSAGPGASEHRVFSEHRVLSEHNDMLVFSYAFLLVCVEDVGCIHLLQFVCCYIYLFAG